MCLAVPGKIIRIENDIATIDYETEKREAGIIGRGFKAGDYVIVQGRIVIQKVPKGDAEKFLKMIKDEG